jgi:hypothetical protein
MNPFAPLYLLYQNLNRRKLRNFAMSSHALLINRNNELHSSRGRESWSALTLLIRWLSGTKVS